MSVNSKWKKGLSGNIVLTEGLNSAEYTTPVILLKGIHSFLIRNSF